MLRRGRREPAGQGQASGWPSRPPGALLCPRSCSNAVLQEAGDPAPPLLVWSLPPLKEFPGTTGRAGRPKRLPTPPVLAGPEGDPLSTEDAAQSGTQPRTPRRPRESGGQSSGRGSSSDPSSSLALRWDGTGRGRGRGRAGEDACDYAGKHPQFRCPWRRLRTLHSPPSMSRTRGARAKSLQHIYS